MWILPYYTNKSTVNDTVAVEISNNFINTGHYSICVSNNAIALSAVKYSIYSYSNGINQLVSIAMHLTWLQIAHRCAILTVMFVWLHCIYSAWNVATGLIGTANWTTVFMAVLVHVFVVVFIITNVSMVFVVGPWPSVWQTSPLFYYCSLFSCLYFMTSLLGPHGYITERS